MTWDVWLVFAIAVIFTTWLILAARKESKDKKWKKNKY